MLITSIVFFILAALLGLYLLSYILTGKHTPKRIVFIHGPLALIGLIILVVYAYIHTSSPWVSIILFIMAALGGVTMIYRDMTGKSVPKWMAIGHGLTATVGLIFLLIFAFGPTH